MKIGTRQIGSMAPPYIIAEIGVNHDGSVERAIELVHAAHAAGADAAKLQWFEADRLLSMAAKLALYQQRSGAADPFEMLRALELDADAMRTIVASAQALGLHAIVTIFNSEIVATASGIEWDAFKLASPDIIHRPLIERLRSLNKPVLLSTGASTEDEVQTAIMWMGNSRFALFQCVSAYPVPDDQAALNGIRALKKLTDAPIGYSDHTTSVDAGALAVACGASILEKHLTWDRNASGPDHAASLDPKGFVEYVRLAHRAKRMMGPCQKRVLEIEQEVRTISRQSIVASRALSSGEVITREDLTIKRPGTGISPAEFEAVIGRRLSRAVQADAPLQEADLE